MQKLFKKYLFEIIVFSSIILYVMAAASVSLNRYWQFDAFWYELGLYDTAIWKVSQFKAPIIEQFNPPRGNWIFADHFVPSLFLLSPVYWFTQKTEAILVLQAVFVGAGAWVALIICKHFKIGKLASVALLTSYLGYVGMQNALYTDFHDTTIASFFIMLAFWAALKNRKILYFLFLIICLGFKENIAGFGVGMGFYLLLSKPRKTELALVTIAISILWFIVVTKAVIPYFSGGYFAYKPEIPQSAPEALYNFFVPIGLKTRTIFLSLITFGFAPVFSLAAIPMIIEHFAERFVLSSAATRWDLGFHYNALLSPILFMSSIPFVLFLKRKSLLFLNVYAVLIIFTVLFLHRFYLHGPLLLAHHPVFYDQTKRAEFMRSYLNKAPKDGLIMTQNNIAAHLSKYKTVLLNVKVFEMISPQIVLLDLREGQNANNFFPLTFDDAKELAERLNLNPNYKDLTVESQQKIYVRVR